MSITDYITFIHVLIPTSLFQKGNSLITVVSLYHFQIIKRKIVIWEKNIYYEKKKHPVSVFKSYFSVLPYNFYMKLFIHISIWSIYYNEFKSKLVYVASGVPQSSNLGPLLFLLFINNLANKLKCDTQSSII